MEFARSTRLVAAVAAFGALAACQGSDDGFPGHGVFSDDRHRDPAPVADARPAQGAAQNPAAVVQPRRDSTALQAPVEMTPELVREVQRRLNNVAGADLAVDGIWGRQTSGAVRDFQVAGGLAVTAELNAETLSALGLDARAH